MTRRTLIALPAAAAAQPHRRRRTLYYNDARHYYLFVFDPPMSMEDAWKPIDEVAGTAVDTFVYGVERGDGLFYPSKVGMRFGEDKRPFDFAAYWRVWHNMQSLMDRGLDPLTVLIDRAHAKRMEFFASVRMSSYGGMNPKFKVTEGGRGMMEPEVRDHQFAVIEELVTRYNTDGIELDFAAAPGGMPPICKPEDAAALAPVLTEYLSKLSRLLHGAKGRPRHLSARVYPTESMCRTQALDVRMWLNQRLVDSVTPMLYVDFNLDPDLPFQWLAEAAHAHQIPVYPMLQPYERDEATGSPTRIPLTAETARAAAANYLARGADGLYTWFLPWPLGGIERSILSELGDPDLIRLGNKRYVLRRRSKEADALGYGAELPLAIPKADPAAWHAVRFHIADDLAQAAVRVRRVRLRVLAGNLVSADRLGVALNGKPLTGEAFTREFGNRVSPYSGQRLNYELRGVRPLPGANTLEFALESRPAGLTGGITIDEVELSIDYRP